MNPGNFADGRKKFEDILYETDEEYQAELDEIEEVFTPLVLKCKENNAVRTIEPTMDLCLHVLCPDTGIPQLVWMSLRLNLREFAVRTITITLCFR